MGNSVENAMSMFWIRRSRRTGGLRRRSKCLSRPTHSLAIRGPPSQNFSTVALPMQSRTTSTHLCDGELQAKKEKRKGQRTHLRYRHLYHRSLHYHRHQCCLFRAVSRFLFKTLMYNPPAHNRHLNRRTGLLVVMNRGQAFCRVKKIIF